MNKETPCLGLRILASRKSKGMTQEELALKVGVAKNTITGYEKGIREPNVLTLKALAATLDVSGDYLLGIEPRKHNISTAAIDIAYQYDRLDAPGQRTINAVISEETARIAQYGRLEATSVQKAAKSTTAREIIEAVSELENHSQDSASAK